MTEVWGVIADIAGLLRAAEVTDWRFLVNAHRAPLRVAVPVTPAAAQELEKDFRRTVEEKLTRPGSRRTPKVQISIRSYLPHQGEVEELLWFDQAARAILDDRSVAFQRDGGRND